MDNSLIQQLNAKNIKIRNDSTRRYSTSDNLIQNRISYIQNQLNVQQQQQQQQQTATMARSYRRQPSSNSYSQQQPLLAINNKQTFSCYNCYNYSRMSASNDYQNRIKHDMYLVANENTSHHTYEASLSTHTKKLIKLLKLNYKHQIKRFLLFFAYLYLILYFFSQFLYDAWYLLSTPQQQLQQQHIQFTYYSYIVFSFHFLCFLILIVIVWLLISHKNLFKSSSYTNLSRISSSLNDNDDYESSNLTTSQIYNDQHHRNEDSRSQSHVSFDTRHNNINNNTFKSCLPSCFLTSSQQPIQQTHIDSNRWSTHNYNMFCMTSKSSIFCCLAKLNLIKNLNIDSIASLVVLILLLVNIIFCKIIFKTKQFNVVISNSSNIIISSSSSSSSNSSLITNSTNKLLNLNSYNELNEYDGIIDIILFTLIFYLFNIIRPLCVLILSTILFGVQTCTIILSNGDPVNSNKITINFILFFVTNLLASLTTTYLENRFNNNFKLFYESLKKRSNLCLDLLKLETLLTNWRSINKLNNGSINKLPKKNKFYEQDFTKQIDSFVEKTKFKVKNSTILYITITSLNEAAHVYMTNELATFFDILYPQIEQISKKNNCDFIMCENENIIITNGYNEKDTNSTLDCVLCALEISRFIEYVIDVSKLRLTYLMGIHIGDIVYILTDEVPNNSKLKQLNNESNGNLNSKDYFFISQIYGSCLDETKELVNSCFTNTIHISKAIYEQLTSDFISVNDLVLQEAYNENKLCYLLNRSDESRSQDKSFQFLPIPLTTKDKLTSIQAKYNLDYQHQAVIEQSLFDTVKSQRLKRIRTKLSNISEVDIEEQQRKSISDFAFDNKNNSLMQNRLIKCVLDKNFNWFTLNYRKHKINRQYWLNEIDNQDNMLKSMFIIAIVVAILLVFQYIFLPKTFLSYSLGSILLTLPLFTCFILIFNKLKIRKKSTNTRSTLNLITYQVKSSTCSPYCVFILKTLLQLSIVCLFYANFVMNFTLYEDKNLSFYLIGILPQLFVTLVFSSIYWVMKFILIKVMFIVEASLIISQSNNNQIESYKMILELFLLSLFMCFIAYLYEMLFRIEFFKIDEENEANICIANNNKQLNKQLRSYLPKRAINFYLSNQDASQYHYFSSNPQVAILNVIIKHESKNVQNKMSSLLNGNQDLEYCKDYLSIMNSINQILQKDRFDSIGLKKCIGTHFIATCGFKEDNYSLASSLTILIEFLFSIQEKINDFNDKMNFNCSISASINIGHVTEALVHVEKPQIDNWGNGILLAKLIGDQAEPNHCVVTEDVYNILKDRYLYRPAGSFIVDDSITCLPTPHIQIYYLLGRIIGDNIFKGKQSLPKAGRPLSLHENWIFPDNKCDNSTNLNRIPSTIIETNNVDECKQKTALNKSSISSESCHTPNTPRLATAAVLPLHFKKDESQSPRLNINSIIQQRNSHCIYLTQDMLVNPNDKKQGYDVVSLDKLSTKESSSFTPLVSPKSEKTQIIQETLQDADEMQEQETCIDCDDVSHIEEQIIESLNELEIKDLTQLRECEELLFSHLNGHNDNFVKEWLDKQYRLITNRQQQVDTEEDEGNIVIKYENEIQESKRFNFATRAKKQTPMPYFPSSTQSSVPSSPNFIKRKSIHVNRVHYQAQKRRFLNSKKHFYQNVTSNRCYFKSNNYGDASDSECETFKLNPIHLEDLIRLYKSSTEQVSSINGDVDTDDERFKRPSRYRKQVPLQIHEPYSPRLRKPFSSITSSNQSRANDALKSRYHSLLLRMSSKQFKYSNSSKANQKILNNLLGRLKSQSESLCSNDFKGLTHQKSCDSEYDNYRPDGLTTDEEKERPQRASFSSEEEEDYEDRLINDDLRNNLSLRYSNSVQNESDKGDQYDEEEDAKLISIDDNRLSTVTESICTETNNQQN